MAAPLQSAVCGLTLDFQGAVLTVMTAGPGDPAVVLSLVGPATRGPMLRTWGSGRAAPRVRSALVALVGLLTPCLSHASRVWVAPMLVHPAADSVDVPRNTRLWVVRGDSAVLDVTLTDPQGAAVPLDVATLTAEDTLEQSLVFTPPQPLAPNTTYVVRALDLRGADFGLPDGGPVPPDRQQALLLSFTTGDRLDADAPPVPRVDGTGAHPDPLGGTLWVLPGGMDGCPLFAVVDMASPGALYMAVARDGDDGAPGLSGEVPVVWAWRGDHHRVGLGVGGGSRRCLEPRDTLRVGAWDAVGNFSGWSEPFRVGAPVTADGCSQVSSKGSLGFLWAVVVFFRRRRR